MGKINKIIELLIDWDNLEDDDLGVDIMSLVETPAIGVSWQAFAAEQFVEVLPGESKDDYISRCIPALIDEGYDQDQSYAICEGSFQEVDGLTEDDAIALINRPDFGETLNFENTVYLDLSKQNFDSASDFLQGVRALDILGLMDATQEPEIKWRYNGPSSSRPFCVAMLALDKVYTMDELKIMGRTIGNGIDSGADAVRKWHGGPHCRHWFDRVQVSRDGSRAVVTNLGPDPEWGIPMASRALAGFRNQASKDRADQWYAIQRSYGMSEVNSMKFSADEEQMIVTGPAMKAFQMIPRKDDDGNLFHVYFSDETVKKIAQKFLADHKQHMTDINHSMEANEENTLIESWIVEDPDIDKAKALGFNPSKGDWYVSYKINNSETWSKIKDGSLTGFSIAGQFLEKAQN